jgi:hypothetical protein
VADRALLWEAVDVERACCPFFAIELDERTVVFAVADPAHDPALDAIADALRGDAPEALRGVGEAAKQAGKSVATRSRSGK